jgi:hypothetical protein
MPCSQGSITGLIGVSVAVNDLEEARRSFARLGLTSQPAQRVGSVNRARVHLAFQGRVDLCAPARDGLGREAQWATERLTTSGEGTYAMTFSVNDVDDARRALESDGIATTRDEEGAVVFTLEEAGARARLAAPPDQPNGQGAAVPYRLYNQTLAVRDLDRAMRTAARLGLDVWGRYTTLDWGLDTAVYRFADGTNLEFVSPADVSRGAAAAVARALEDRGEGHYMTVFETDNVDAVYAGVHAAGVTTLGPPVLGPSESPWGPCRQFWVHPRASHSTFIEFLTQAMERKQP